MFVTDDTLLMGYKSADEKLEQIILKDSSVEYSTQNALNGNVLDIIEWARNGVSMNFLTRLGEKLSFSLNDLSMILHVSLRTLQRYSPTKVLDTGASAMAIQLASLRKHGLEVFEDEEAFNQWLRIPISSLDGKKPIEFLDTTYGFELINQLLGRIEHGVFA